jgi:phosphate/sulfate permease
MTLGSILEFAGAVGVGGRVADTIRTKVVSIDAFEDSPALLMLGMVCAVVASSLYLTFATKVGLPVSSTHSILGAVLGMGIGALGGNGVLWVGHHEDGSVDISGGVVQVFLAWIIAPILAGAAGAILFTITKYTVLLRSNPALKGLIAIPIFAWITGTLIAMLLIWKGGSYTVDLSDGEYKPTNHPALTTRGLTSCDNQLLFLELSSPPVLPLVCSSPSSSSPGFTVSSSRRTGSSRSTTFPWALSSSAAVRCPLPLPTTGDLSRTSTRVT